uniref:DC-STAMP domain-containing protein 1-like n=1 Tax=Phallusia mammillata TaxID=59560 RepID=A0A6F9DB61_9ASCI|nr:DC-STAMP domain-containing protein 1-like [Phallusia mammillata]
MVGRTGRGALQALLATWILAGPISNIMYHSGEVVHSMTCISRMQSEQMGKLMHLLHAPVTAGLRQVVDDAEAMNETEEAMSENLDQMKQELWSKELHEANDRFEEDQDIAGKLRTDAVRRCTGVFGHGIAECVRFFRQKEQDCWDTIGIPIIRDILCAVLKASFLCDVVGYFDTMCQGVPHTDNEAVNRNYSDMNKITDKLDDEFDTEMKWKVPLPDQKTGVVTVEEIAQRLESDYAAKKRIFDFSITLIKKFVAVSFIFVLTGAFSYNKNYLRDVRFDNLYVTSYFQQKDAERKNQGKRHLIPLSRLEKRNVIFPTALKLTQAEKKSVVFKLIKIVANILFTILLLLFDHVIYKFLYLIRKHGKVDVDVSARHMLEVVVEGNRTVAVLLKRLFKPFEDNDHVLDSSTTNLDCLPVAKKTPISDYIWIGSLYSVLLFTVMLDAYALRLRHVIAAIAYRRREKSRIVMLYGDLMRRRKNRLAHVRLSVQKLARNFRLKQKHSLLEVIRFKFPFLDRCFNLLGLGKLRCLICEDKESSKRPLITCEEEKCRIRYCHVCWQEVGECCWACKNYEPTEEERMEFGIFEEPEETAEDSEKDEDVVP